MSKAVNTMNQKLTALDTVFNNKFTENGDITNIKPGTDELTLFFQAEYFTRHLEEVEKYVRGSNDIRAQLFSMFMRDPRNGMGWKALGRELMKQTGVDLSLVPLVGRYDDLLEFGDEGLKFLWAAIQSGDNLAKKWAPRLGGKYDDKAKKICKLVGITQKEYRKAISVETTEKALTEKRADQINFSAVPSLAMLKYYRRFLQEEAFKAYLEKLHKGESKINTAITNVYDLYKHLEELGDTADIIFKQFAPISKSIIPIVDTSGSMTQDDCIGRAYSIGHYLAKYSTYCPDTVISFSSKPQLMKLYNKVENHDSDLWYIFERVFGSSVVAGEMRSMYTGDCSNTDFGKVMDLLAGLKEFPEYLVVLSDMEFDAGSCQSKDDTMEIFKKHGANTKIVWWNLNTRNQTSPETDKYGNIFISGYNPQMLQFLEVGFDCYEFLNKLLLEYGNKLFKIMYENKKTI